MKKQMGALRGWKWQALCRPVPLYSSEADALAGLHIHRFRQLQNGLDKQLGGGQAGGCRSRRSHLLLAPGRQQLGLGGCAHACKVALQGRAGGARRRGGWLGRTRSVWQIA